MNQSLGKLLALGLLAALAPTAQASCAEDFARDNRMKPEAGPYRIQMSALLPVKHTQVVEVVPPRSVRQTMRVAGTTTETIIVGDQSWSKEDGQWEPLQLLKSASAFTTYDDVQAEREMLECATKAQGVGKPTRTYSYRYTSSSGLMTVAMGFDAATGLPLQMSTIDAKGRKVLEMRYTVDRSIRIDPPKP